MEKSAFKFLIEGGLILNHLNNFAKEDLYMEVIEQELKYKLNKEDYFKLQQYLDNNCIKYKSVIQTNYYIDNGDFILNKNNITARIRNILGEKYEFTLKIPQSNNNDIKHAAIKKEVSVEIDKIATEKLLENGIWDKELIDILYKNIDLPIYYSKFRVIGSLKTERALYNVKDFNEFLNIDKSTYLDIEDYEVEWETTELDKYNEVLLNIFHAAGVNYLKNKSSKNSRFIKRLNEIIHKHIKE